MGTTRPCVIKHPASDQRGTGNQFSVGPGIRGHVNVTPRNIGHKAPQKQDNIIQFEYHSKLPRIRLDFTEFLWHLLRGVIHDTTPACGRAAACRFAGNISGLSRIARCLLNGVELTFCENSAMVPHSGSGCGTILFPGLRGSPCGVNCPGGHDSERELPGTLSNSGVELFSLYGRLCGRA